MTKLKTQILTKLENSNCDKNQKNQIVTKPKKSNCDSSNSDSSDSSSSDGSNSDVDTLTNDAMFAGQRFAILTMFLLNQNNTKIVFSESVPN